DRDGRGRRLRCEARRLAPGRHDNGYLSTHQIGGQHGQATIVAARPAKLDRHVLALVDAALLQAATERLYEVLGILRRARAHESDHWHRRLLRPRCERPRDRRAAEQHDELATPIKKLTAHETAAAGLSSTEKPSAARRLTRRRACVSGRRRSK